MNQTKLDGKSEDIVSDNIEKLKEIFPEIVTEDKIDFDKLKLILGENIETDTERYNFTWPGKTQAIKESQKQSTGTLRPCKKESKNWNTTQNLYIEGDNLEILKLLQKTYYNKVKMIYIDPPYNTGKDFVYPDNYTDNIENYLKITGQSTNINGGEKQFTKSTNTETDGRYHSNWLNMIYPRLKLGKNLLKDDGIIFISIDDNEVENLKKMCDEIFGEENFIENYIWENTFRPDNSSKITRKNSEYILCYCKYKNNIKQLIGGKSVSNGLPSLTKNSMKKSTLTFRKKTVKFYLKDGTYLSGDKGNYFLHDDVIVKNGTNINDFKLTGRVIWGQEYLDKQISKGTEIIIKNKSFTPYTKKNEETIQSPNKIIPKTKVGDILEANAERDKLFNKKIFDYPKPTSLIKYLISYLSDKNFIILDFFAGSSTTADSIMQLNSEDKGNRKFIMIQIPEKTNEKSEAYKAGYKNICEIGKERIRRAGDKILEESDNKNLDIGFKVFKLDSSNIQKWDPEYENLTESLDKFTDNIKEDRTEEDLVYEIMLKYGIDLTLPIQKENIENHTIYSVGYGALLICLEDNITKDICKPIINLSKDSISTRIVFKDSGFKSDSDKTNIKETLKVNNIEEFITI
ncbi:MAG: site-specific DNA-methyltransferase [Methanobrevibacter boviskoreani]|jgi:adenine-specific DNA-methyltransferase|uniref:site-specific DNA-methyltransferase n=2 Tax=Methanobrevibacter boviskoreani TaxID=1348249 RepID=UPI002A909544|nr:site-specific DNA-methyltransferase [Methanobrevibacter boviskoreani]MDY5613723.1 site-specific DNA-methyltransferase [Methanobrevibacter boviskoreani]